MDINILYKIILFWVIFYITPGPVWIAVMETTRRLSFTNILQFFFKVFLTVNVFVQFSQALISVLFVEFVSKTFSNIELFFYIFGAIYILYLAYKTLKSTQKNSSLQLTFYNLAIVMLLSPKIWLLFPAGALIANQLHQDVIINAFVFAFAMLIVSNLMFFVYVAIGRVGTKLLGNNFSYLAFGLLILFALFLFNEAFQIIINSKP